MPSRPLPPRTLLLLALLLPLAPAHSHTASGQNGIVATVHPLATQAAINAFRQGGNAIDAAVAAALTLGVVDSANSGLGGGCLLLIRRPDGSLLALDGRETAPAAATRDLFLRHGRADTTLSQTGPLAVGVPGSLAAYDLALRHAGRLPLRDLLLPAADLADRGFTLDATYTRRLREAAPDLQRFPAARAIFLDPKGLPWKPGTQLRQPDLAATYRSIAQRGPDWFYRGPFAASVGAWMQAHGGILTAADFHHYEVRLRSPLRTRYRAFEIVGFPPPSSGGVHVAQILNILEHFDLPTLGPRSPQTLHLVAEAMKRAFADRAYWLGDADFVPVPRGLTDKAYAAQLASTIDPTRATPVPTHGTPPRASDDLFRSHTTHFATADAEGNWVACTATINTSFGSKVVVPGTGVILNNQMDDFSLQPGVTNYFGLLGQEANAVASRKRPLSSMSPTLVLREGQPVLALGAAGGPTIISQVVLALLGVLDFHLPLPAALAQPRYHHQWQPDSLKVERNLPARLRRDLRQRGHTLSETSSLGVSQAVGRTPDGRRFLGVADPRTPGRAAGW